MFLLINKNDEELEFQGSLKDCYDYRLQNLDQDYCITELTAYLVSQYLGFNYDNFRGIINDDITVKGDEVDFRAIYWYYVGESGTEDEIQKESIDLYDIADFHYTEIR